ncbi:thaumatin-like pathogenesis-related protein 4 [Phragmites australis]|uniref:thaumatin-like pathogenesis-related protein 4 n=1 Tax=Phragmites australis TaxID=29695 RepID=UPI002D78745D|nr:thaumatin-like pathogenesis-related protein 4 [Phragmites australis]
MASPAASSVLFLVLAAFAAGASAATFTVTNNCGFTVWPAATPVGGGRQLDPHQTWTFDVPAGTSSGRVWGRTGCSFNGGRGSCQTGDCGGALSCTLSGQPPLTLAEFTIGGAQDFYDISVIDRFNIGMAFSCSTGVGLVCRDSSCPDAYHQPNEMKTHACNGNSNYQVTFCP